VRVQDRFADLYRQVADPTIYEPASKQNTLMLCVNGVLSDWPVKGRGALVGRILGNVVEAIAAHDVTRDTWENASDEAKGDLVAIIEGIIQRTIPYTPPGGPHDVIHLNETRVAS
jgi:hypothetical protein